MGMEELKWSRGAAGRGECRLQFVSLMAESADSRHTKEEPFRQGQEVSLW